MTPNINIYDQNTHCQETTQSGLTNIENIDVNNKPVQKKVKAQSKDKKKLQE